MSPLARTIGLLAPCDVAHNSGWKNFGPGGCAREMTPMSTVTGSAASRDRQWFIVGRWEEFDAEGRANLLRVLGILAFYSVELANYHGVNLGFLQLPRVEGVDHAFHVAVTRLAVAWVLLALAILVCLQRRVFPTWLKYISTGGDLVLLTSMLVVADGPKSPLVVGYFLILALAALRFSLSLVWFTTLGSMAGYLFVLGYARWYAPPGRDLHIDRYEQLMFLLALGLTGIVLGQIVRRVRRMADDYATRVRAAA